MLFQTLKQWLRLTAALGLAIALTGCIEETVTTNRPGIGEYAPDRGSPISEPITGPIVAETPRSETAITYRAAAVNIIGEVDYDRHSLPLIRPGGEYLVVQRGEAPTWPTVFAQSRAIQPIYTSQQIYRIEHDAQSGRITLAEHLRIRDVGILGRSADAEGFLVEAPQADGSRWIGKVAWESGEVEWLVRGSDINAFAALSPQGRLAWCRRPVEDGDGTFELFIQADNEVWRVPADAGEWLFPIWARSGETLFALQLSARRPPNPPALDLVALDVRRREMLDQWQSRRRLLEAANRSSAYKMISTLQDHADPVMEDRMLFFHAGTDFGRVCLFDPGRDGLQLLTRATIAAAWTADGRAALLASEDTLYFQSVSLGESPIELLGGAYVPRRVGHEIYPYMLFSPVPRQPGRIRLIAMRLITSPAEAEAAERMPGRPF